MGKPEVERMRERLAGLLEEMDRIEKEADGFPAVIANVARIRAALNMIRVNLGGSVFE